MTLAERASMSRLVLDMRAVAVILGLVVEKMEAVTGTVAVADPE